MNITHEYIRAIVGTEPQEWWPELCHMGDDGWWFNRLAATNHHVQPELAYLAFVGAAVEWWLKLHPDTNLMWHEGEWSAWNNTIGIDAGRPCLLSALVAAIREVGK